METVCSTLRDQERRRVKLSTEISGDSIRQTMGDSNVHAEYTVPGRGHSRNLRLEAALSRAHGMFEAVLFCLWGRFVSELRVSEFRVGLLSFGEPNA